ncbi:MAG: hypothetical protein COT85_06000 [Chlamydiae bacterium CG10_big_fil_rev_8_21_14_0_10_42_34]|nr:MAG: hypothetical protein COT85_06000 [Chlamydiae bacterium CG10_big_fil_rev_8_21_14_0_10_42_34]
MVQTKALYNLLRLNAAEDPSVKVDSWALQDFRSIPLDELFARLEKSGIRLDKAGFHQFSDPCDTPEELADLLLPDDISEADRDPLYLLIFEVWRRLLPEKQSLSIFCDEIDYRISLYDQEDLKSDELIQDALANLLEVLEENTDAGAEPEAVFTAICEYCAHDLESFLYEYISDLLDSGNSLYASELVEGFSPYILEPLWFDFLRVRLLGFTDSNDANTGIRKLLESDLELLLILEIVRFLSFNGEHELFSLAVNKALPLLAESDELNDLMAMVADYYRRLDLDDMEEKIQKLIDKRKDAPIRPEELKILKDLLATS